MTATQKPGTTAGNRQGIQPTDSAPFPSADLAASPETSTTPSAPRDHEGALCALQNELFSVHALLLAIQRRLDDFEEEENIDCNSSDELGRLLTLAARDVFRLASVGTEGGAA